MVKGIAFFSTFVFLLLSSIQANSYERTSCDAGRCCSCTQNYYRKGIPYGAYKHRYYYPCCSVFVNSRVFALPDDDDEVDWAGRRDDDFVDALTKPYYRVK
ncbi:hypothetical protein [Criblamydia sequanensis]|uniref:Conserved putative secreted protein n=1 Tax=Candidatus Criblamydia sequanensis CRIB-18 TaxID=1437425 RepID=A0A090E3E7_9BACT|nr:hypothetical protein [Criblamydia sequanensis]CDR35114.1 Conserved putative secreted protein [Criblamydia sequanensis CRIB-18]